MKKILKDYSKIIRNKEHDILLENVLKAYLFIGNFSKAYNKEFDG